MPSKPIPQGYKLFAVADQGYIWTFEPASRSKGLVGFIKYNGLLMTRTMVIKMLKRLPLRSNVYTVYLDNYFTSITLFNLLRNRLIGACGTTRSKQKDIPQLIRLLKAREVKLPWNTLCAVP